MTHTPVPPRPVLSPDGQRIACADGEGVWLIDHTGPHRVSTTHAVALASWGSDGVVVAGARSVSSLAPDGRVRWTRAFDADAGALAVADGLIAIGLTGDRSWVELVDPATAESTSSIDVGAAVFEGLLATPEAVAFWGFAGADGDTGPWFGRLATIAGVDMWTGDGAQSEPQGVLWPLAPARSDRECIGVFDLSSLRILQRTDDDAWTQADTRPWPGRGLSASSAGGRFVATLTADWNGLADVHAVRVVDLRMNSVVLETGVAEPGQFPTIAVDDDARLTLASGFAGGEVRVLTCSVDGTTTVRHRLTEAV